MHDYSPFGMNYFAGGLGVIHHAQWEYVFTYIHLLVLAMYASVLNHLVDWQQIVIYL